MHLVIVLAAIAAYVHASMGSCTSDEFMCRNGACIDVSLLCDGTKECPDASDEVFSACYNVTCSGFRCNYGGCIDSSLKCDNINDCWDSSDENKFLCANETTIVELFAQLQGSCSDEYIMQCPQSGKCLKHINVCDGIRDCEHGEDEDQSLCGGDECPFDSFRCENGACIAKSSLCNLNVDCYDGSDEIPAICRKIHMQDSDSEYGEGPMVMGAVWQSYGCPLDPTPGMQVAHYFSKIAYRSDGEVPHQSTVLVTCDDGYKVFGANINKCVETKWQHEWIPCTRYCEPSSYLGSIVYATECIEKFAIVDCTEEQHSLGTQLLISCASGYESDSADNLVGHHVCDENGEWTVVEANPICTPICGVKSPHHPGITPWAVSLFQRTLPGDVIYTFKCMGTILSPFIVITADACFSEAAEAYSPLFFKVVEGDHKIEFREDEDHGYTLHNLMEIHIVTYRNSYKAALLRVIKPFIFGARVRPACLPLYDDMKPPELEGVFHTDQLGEGHTEYENSKYYLLYFVASQSIKYNVRNFFAAIIDDISKSEQNL